MSTLTRTRPLATPGGLQYPKITVFVTIPNTGRRAASRQDALVPVVRAYGAELRIGKPADPFEQWARLDRNGDRTAMLSGERELVELLANHVVPSTIERMERAAGDTMKIYNRFLRATESHANDLPFMRRRFRNAFLRNWGRAFADRAAALEAFGEPEWHATLTELADGAEPDAWTEARRAVAGLDEFDVFTRGVSAHARAARERLAAFETACKDAGTTPDEVLEIQYEAQNRHVRGPIELGEIEHGETARLILALGDQSGLAGARAEVLGPILAAAGARRHQEAADRWGQIVMNLSGPEPVIALIHERAAVILERAEAAARIGLHDVYVPYVRRFSNGGVPFAERDRRAWRADFLRGWGDAFAGRLHAALEGRADAPYRAGADPETVGAVPTHDRAGERLALEQLGASYGRAAVERMEAADFTALAAALGGTALLSAPVIEQLPESAGDVDELDAARVRIPNIDGRGRERLAALAPVIGAYRLQIARVDAETNAYGSAMPTALYATITGPAALVGHAARTAARLILVMDRAADRAARSARAGEAYVSAYREGWGSAYAARIAAALAGDPGARAELPHEQAGPAYLAALAVDDFEAAEVHAAAARIAAASDPTGLPAQASVTLVFAPGPSGYLACHRSRAVQDLAEVYGLTAQHAGHLDQDGPVQAQRELLRVTGSAPLVETFTAAAGRLLAAADALISQLLPAFERQLYTRSATRRDQGARASRRADFVSRVVRDYLRAFGERLTAQLAGKADRPRRTAGEEVDARAAYTAVYALEAAELAEQAAAVLEADAELLAAWLVRLSPASPEPPVKVLIVPCGKAKRDEAAPARTLYTGSYHRAAMRAAVVLAGQNPGTKIAILSAKYGLITDLDVTIEPYDLAAGEPGAIVPAQLRRQVMALGLARAEVTVLGGSRYTKMARAVWSDARAPLSGAGGMGRQIQQLTRIAARGAVASHDEEPER